MTTRKEFQDRVKFYERQRGLSFGESLEAALNEFVMAARKEEREHCVRLIEAPIPGLRELIPTLKEPRIAYIQIDSLHEAANSIRESGEFTDALRKAKDQSQEKRRSDV